MTVNTSEQLLVAIVFGLRPGEDVNEPERLALTKGYEFKDETLGRLFKPGLKFWLANKRRFDIKADKAKVKNETHRLEFQADMDLRLPSIMMAVEQPGAFLKHRVTLLDILEPLGVIPKEPEDDDFIPESQKDALAAFDRPNEPTVPAEPNEPAAAPFPACPTDEELIDLYKGTAWATVIDSVREVAKIKPILPIMTAAVLQSALMARCIRVAGRKPNCYGMALAERARGKGTCQDLLDACLAANDVEQIDNSSQKTMMKGFARLPWGALLVGEFEPYIKQNSFFADCVSVLNNLFDGKQVSNSSEKTGRVCIQNAAPCVFVGMQPTDAMLAAMKRLMENGFVSRYLMAIDNAPQREFGRLPPRSGRSSADPAPVIAAFREAYSWLPAPMAPSDEVEGRWVHPFATADMAIEPFDDLWTQHDFPGAVLGEMTRYRNNYLPLLSIPFCQRPDLERRVITAAAQERGQRALLAFYHGLVGLLDLIPQVDGEALQRKILNKVKAAAEKGITRRDLTNRLAYPNPRDLENAITVLRDRSLIRSTVTRNHNGTETITYWSTSKNLDVRLPKMEPFKPTPPGPVTVTAINASWKPTPEQAPIPDDGGEF